MSPGRRRPQTAQPKERSRTPVLLLAAALAALALTAYFPVRHFDFLQFDDADYVTENRAVLAGITSAGVRWAFSLTSPYAGNWHPLTWLSHMLDVQLFGPDPGWHHLSSIFWHVLSTLALFFLLVRMTSHVGPSVFVAALFAVHPLRVESVAWIAERKDVLSTFWLFMTMAAYVAFVARRTPLRYGLVVAAFALALMSKPMVVTLPFLLLLLDVWPLRRWQPAAGWRAAWPLVVEKLPLLLMTVAGSLITVYAQRRAGAVQSLEDFPLALRIAKIPVAYAHYLISTVWPANLAALYPYPASIPLWQSLSSVLVLAAITAAAIRWVRTRPYLFVGWFWFLGMLVPVIGLLQAGAQPYADRFMYGPGVGLFVMAAWAARDLVAAFPFWRPRVIAAGALVTLACLIATMRVVPHWRNSVTLWEQATRATSGNYRAHTNLGFALAAEGQRTRAIAEYHEAIRINPKYANAHNYLGVAHADLGEHRQAVTAFDSALALRPRFAEAWNNLGLSKAALEEVPEAIHAFQKSLEADANFSPARNNLAIAYARQRDFESAIREFTESARQQPDSAETRLNLATALASAGRRREATAEFEAAAQRGADPVRVHYAWGSALMDLGDAAGAAAQFTLVLRANPRFVPALHDLGRALAHSGRLREAIDSLQIAAQLEPQNADIRHDLGAAFARGGLIKEAIAAMEAALAIDPGHQAAREALRALRKE